MQLPALESEYAAATDRARRFVASHFALEVCDPASPDYPPTPEHWRQVWTVTVDNQEALELLVAIPKNFPDQLPTVYVPSVAIDPALQIPHLDARRLLCTFDPNEAIPNIDVHPGEIVMQAIHRGEQLWRDGLAGANQADFDDEWEAYWEQSITNEVLSLVELAGGARKVAAIRLSPPWKGKSWLVASGKAEGTRWLAAVGYTPPVTSVPALYLPINDLGRPPFPMTNRDVYRRLETHDPAALQRLLEFLGSHKRPSGILFSVRSATGGHTMGMWWHTPFFHEVRSGPRSVKRQVGVIPGFTPGPRAARIELIGRHGDQALVRGAVTRVDRARLLRRTAGVACDSLIAPVSIVGCGSIGSLLAESLARSGIVPGLRPIDPDVLTVENVMRHLCGMSDVGEAKVAAVSQKIGRQFPHVACEPHAHDVLDLLRTNPRALEPSSLCVVAVGAYSVERRLNRLAHAASSGWAYPLCFVWVEPYLYGGHAVLIRREYPGCFECAFDDDLLFKTRVIHDPHGFTRRESGCQTTYMPYSGADAVQFAAALTRFLIAALNATENVVFSWSGDLDEARTAGIALQPEWEQAPSFTARQAPLVRSPACRTCVP